jgi:hypothetical protein
MGLLLTAPLPPSLEPLNFAAGLSRTDRPPLPLHLPRLCIGIFTRGEKIKVRAETELTFRLDRTLALSPKS